MNQKLLELIRQLSQSDTKTLSQKALKATEEIGELAKVVLPFEDAFACKHRFVDRLAILEEVADVMLTVMSIAYNLDFEDSDLEEMIKEKSLYWAELQTRDREAKFPVPYEIHVTVKTDNVDTFKQTCLEANVKPLLLDLQNSTGDSVLQEMMTSSIHIGNNSSAYAEMKRIADYLNTKGIPVIRQKIETVPWHPAAPSEKHASPTMPKDCYFESHLAIIVNKDNIDDLRDFVTSYSCHLSKNVFKRIDDENFIIMATYRKYDGVYESFKDSLEKIKNEVLNAGYQIEKTIVEFSVYDSRINHDAAWLMS